MSEFLVMAENLARNYGSRRALDGISFAVRAGEVFGFLGPNGAGKTTTVKLLTGQLQASSGEARVLGVVPWQAGRRLRSQVGYMGEAPGHYDRLSVRSNLRFFTRILGLGAGEVDRVLELVGLSERAGDPVRSISRGMRQRLALGRALLGQPRILFLDEPTAGLDPRSARSVRALVGQFRAQGSVFLTTHDMEEAQTLCDRVAVLDGGRILMCGTPNELCREVLGCELPSAQDTPSLEKVFLRLTGRSLEQAGENHNE